MWWDLVGIVIGLGGDWIEVGLDCDWIGWWLGWTVIWLRSDCDRIGQWQKLCKMQYKVSVHFYCARVIGAKCVINSHIMIWDVEVTISLSFSLSLSPWCIIHYYNSLFIYLYVSRVSITTHHLICSLIKNDISAWFTFSGLVHLRYWSDLFSVLNFLNIYCCRIVWSLSPNNASFERPFEGYISLYLHYWDDRTHAHSTKSAHYVHAI